MIYLASSHTHGELLSRITSIPEYLKYSFVRNALAVTVLIALCAALLGVILVLRRFSLSGDGLSHVAFGSAAIAATFGIFDLGLTLPITVIAAVIILKGGEKRRSKYRQPRKQK